MEDTFISFETAKLTLIHCLHSYDIECKHYYTSDGILRELYWDEDWSDLSRKTKVYIKAPTQSLLQKWLREVHDTHIYLNIGWLDCEDGPGWISFTYNLINIKTCKTISRTDGYGFTSPNTTYEQALEIGLQESLKLIK